MITLDAGSVKCPGGTVLGNDPAWNDDFRVKEEGLKDAERKRQGDRDSSARREGAVGCHNATEDPRKVGEEEERVTLGGKQLGSEDDPKGDTDTARSNEEEEKEEKNRGSRRSFGVGEDSKPARKEDTAKEPCHIPGGAWLQKVWRFFTSNVPVGVKGHEREVMES
ncbi:hypothetical protein NDU88_001861 [Pleurodeles waltl]|uniref:Uncharacterized protein n=1 Tax=Pleurodeles waltl TaxID=8319 RepID=A0AAV7SCS1_PLEWA|nr:hypothetical protein NDU88_001861 [Pleurodeles waltl]